MLTNFTKTVAIATILLGMLNINANAQAVSVRPYQQIYSENLKGGTTMLGNTILRAINADSTTNTTVMNQTSAGTQQHGVGYSDVSNDVSTMVYVDIDGNTGVGATTRNSSSADLILPAGTNVIKFARLYWGGRIKRSTTNYADTIRTIDIRKGNSGAYTHAVASAMNVDKIDMPNSTQSTNETVYQCYVDVTQFINTLGAGTYTVANIPVSQGRAGGGGGYYGGWSLVVAYENTSMPYNSIRAYDGFYQVSSSATQEVTLTGLNVPNNPLASEDASMGTIAWEGDASIFQTSTNPAGDYLQVNGFTVSNYANPGTNFWNGSISKNGAYVTTKNPNYSDQMGIDIDEVNVGTGFNIQPNDTTVKVKFGTERDQYFPSAFTFTIRMKDPLVTLDKTVTDGNGDGYVDGNEILTYVLSGENAGNGVAYNAVIVDTLPSNVTYIPNTLEVVNGAGVTSGIKTDANDNDEAMKGTAGDKTYVKFFVGAGATSSTGGQLPAAPNGAYSVKFQVRAAAIPGSITNTARITANSQGGDVFTDDGTAIINAAGGPTPVKMTTFKASLVNKNGYLQWTTESELNSNYFIVERSNDGVHFDARGKVAANGTTSFTHNYTYTDVINTNSPIVYYRLKIVDNDGQYGFSKIVAIKLNGSLNVNDMNVFPNPFISDIKVSVTSPADELATFRIISFDGKEMMNRKVSLQKGDNIVVLTDFGKITKGSYILEVSTSTDKFIKKIVKN
ncbi:MAG: T9SS type A sorting domain-containing protein [Ferruginibacter sp.]